MIRWIFKYSACLLILNTIILSIPQTYVLGNQVFLSLMGLFAILLILNPKAIKEVILHKAFSFFLFINIINIIYFIFFHNFSDIEAIKYLLARGVQFSIISISVFFHLDFYKYKFPELLVNITFILFLISLFLYPDIFSGRYSGLIWNPNMLSSLSVIVFALLFLSEKNKSNLDVFKLSLFLTFALASGSRGTLVALFLIFLLKYGFSYKNFFFGFVFIVVFFLVKDFQLDTSFNRISSQTILNDRILQFKYAIESIKNKYLFGYGLDKYAYIDKSLVPLHLKGALIGAHNGYLAILTQYGMIFGSMILLMILRQSYLSYTFFINNGGYSKIFIFIILYTLIASIYESLMVGINEFHTVLFWLSLSIISLSRFYAKQ